jgi:hypothetical protein
MISTRADQPSQDQEPPDRVLAFSHIGDLHITASVGVFFEDGLLGARLGPLAGRFYVD